MSVASLYKETSITTQSKGKLVVMLYDGAIKFLKLAIRAIEENDFESRNKDVQKAMKIIEELNIVLDMDIGGDIALNLRKLYNFMLNHLTQANIKNDKGMVEEVITMLETLNEGWKDIAE